MIKKTKVPAIKKNSDKLSEIHSAKNKAKKNIVLQTIATDDINSNNKTNTNLNNKEVLPIMPPIVLAFGGSDPTTASGLQADIQTITAIGCYPTSVLTAITVQDTVGVSEIHGLSPDIVLRQAQAILEDMSVSAFKIGLVGNTECAHALGDLLENYDDIPLIFAPVLTTAAGEDFASDDILEAVCEDLISQTTILSLDIFEAQRIVAFITNQDCAKYGADECADILLDSGCEYVLISAFQTKENEILHNLFHHQNKNILTLSSPRFLDEQIDVNGTLASAIACYMAHGIEITTAVRLAQSYTWQSFRESLRLGMGRVLPNRMYWRNETIGLPLNSIGEEIFSESKLDENYPGN